MTALWQHCNIQKKLTTSLARTCNKLMQQYTSLYCQLIKQFELSIGELGRRLAQNCSSSASASSAASYCSFWNTFHSNALPKSQLQQQHMGQLPESETRNLQTLRYNQLIAILGLADNYERT